MDVALAPRGDEEGSSEEQKCARAAVGGQRRWLLFYVKAALIFRLRPRSFLGQSLGSWPLGFEKGFLLGSK